MKKFLVVRRICTSAFALSVFAGCAYAQPQSIGQKLINAASNNYGARVSVEAGPEVIKDKQTSPEAYLDGNAHTRYVLTGTPYSIIVQLPFAMKVEKLSLANSDYASEAAPKDVAISFDDAAPIQHTLELGRPVKLARSKAQIVWQDVPVGREVSRIKITVLSNYPGTVKWGGLADLAVWTSTDLDARFRIEGHDDKAPVFVHPTALQADAAPVKATVPEAAKAGEHPRLIFTPSELAAFRQNLQQREKGKSALATFLKIADGALAAPVEFPSVEDTVANKAGKAHQVLSHHAAALGFAYALTNDEKYARAARGILVGYAQRYQSYPQHGGFNKNDASKITVQRLSEAMWLIPQLEAYDYLLSGKVLSEDDKNLIASGLIRPAIEEIRRQQPAPEAAGRDRKNPDWRTTTPPPSRQGNYSNWLNFYSTATIMAGALLDDKDMMDLAAADLRTAIATGIGDDGMWGEGAIGYQLFAMGAMVPGLETAAHNGYDLWNSSNGRFKMLFDSPLRYAYPDGTLPGINDSGRAQLGSWQTIIYDYGLLRYGDASYRALVNDTPRQLHTSDDIYAPTRFYTPLEAAASVKMGSTIFGSLGYAILRDDLKYTLLDYGPHGGTHGHFDKLNLELYALPPGGVGDEMGGEPNFHFYDNPSHATWTKTTIAHNTMAVDEKSQAENEGKLLVYEDTPQLKIMRGESSGSYAGVLLDRTVVVTPDVVIDVFAGRSALDHMWDRTFRYNGKLQGLPMVPDAKALGAQDGYQNFKVSAQQDAAQGWNGVWDTKAGQFTVTLAGAPKQQVMLGTGPDADEMALARQNGKSADFAAAYALDGWKNPVLSVRWLVSDAAANGAVAAEIKQQDGTTTRVVVAHAPDAWQVGDWKSDARVFVAREKGDDLHFLIGGGNFAAAGANELRQPVAGNYSGEKRDGRFTLAAQWTP